MKGCEDVGPWAGRPLAQTMTLLREGARRVLMALGEPVDPPERLPHLRDDHPFRRLQR